MIYLKLLLTAFFWGGTFIAGKMIAPNVHPVSAAFLRFAIAAICLLSVVIRTQGRLPVLHRRQWILVFLLGISGVFAYNILFFSGLRHIEAGRASLIIATNPILISLLSTLIFKERLNRIKTLGICLSVAGAIIVISNGRLADLTGTVGLGELLIFGCVLSWVAYSLIGKVAMAGLSPLVAVTYSAVAGALLLLPAALYCGMAHAIGSYAIRDWISLGYLSVFGTVLGFFWYYQGIERIGPSRAGVFINFVPISAVALSFFMLNEPLSIALIVGGGTVLAGIYLTNAPDAQMRIKRNRRD